MPRFLSTMYQNKFSTASYQSNSITHLLIHHVGEWSNELRRSCLPSVFSYTWLCVNNFTGKIYSLRKARMSDTFNFGNSANCIPDSRLQPLVLWLVSIVFVTMTLEASLYLLLILVLGIRHYQCSRNTRASNAEIQPLQRNLRIAQFQYSPNQALTVRSFKKKSYG